MNGKNKGSGFEREICKCLSLWWTHGERDDIFWRSTTSGAWAHVRSKGGKSTSGQYGDIQAIDPIGKPLVDLITIECKRGYKEASFSETLDLSMTGKAPSQWERFLEQVLEERERASTPYWMLITKRDRHEAVCFLPLSLYRALNKTGASLSLCSPRFKFQPVLRRAILEEGIFATQLQELFIRCKPETFSDLNNEVSNDRD